MKEPPVIGKPTAETPIGNSKSKLFVMLDNRWVVLAAIFFAMMFLGLPLLWRCPAFSRLEKFIWTIVVLVYSGLIIWGFILVMKWSFSNISRSLGY